MNLVTVAEQAGRTVGQAHSVVSSVLSPVVGAVSQIAQAGAPMVSAVKENADELVMAFEDGVRNAQQ